MFKIHKILTCLRETNRTINFHRVKNLMRMWSWEQWNLHQLQLIITMTNCKKQLTNLLHDVRFWCSLKQAENLICIKIGQSLWTPAHERDLYDLSCLLQANKGRVPIRSSLHHQILYSKINVWYKDSMGIFFNQTASYPPLEFDRLEIPINCLNHGDLNS